MTLKIGINGLGRIGRMVIRSLIENNNNNIEIKHINSRSNSEVVSSLLKYDSIHGKFNCEIKHKDGSSKTIKVLCRIDTENEVEYYKNGGILQYVLRNMIS